MEVNAVTAPVRNALVINATTNPAPTQVPIFYTDCEDILNAMGNCYECNKPGQVRRDCLEKTQTQTQAQSIYNRGQRRELICFNCDKKGAHCLGLQGTQEE